MGFFKGLVAKSKKSDGMLNHLTLRQLKEQYGMLFKIENENQLEMTFGEWKEIKKAESPRQTKYKKVYLVIDDQLINSNDVQSIIEPLWWSVNICDGEKEYEKDLSKFTIPQRHVFAIQWYLAEVNNGGHSQFYGNSTGIVWEDAMRGFEAISAQENVGIIKQSAARMGGKPSKNREKREKQMEKYDIEFDDLDDLYYESEMNMLELLCAYIRNNAKDFYFSGEISIPE